MRPLPSLPRLASPRHRFVSVCARRTIFYRCRRRRHNRIFSYYIALTSLEDIFHLTFAWLWLYSVLLHKKTKFVRHRERERKQKHGQWMCRVIFALVCSFALNRRHMYSDSVIASMNNGRHPSVKDRNNSSLSLSLSRSAYFYQFIVIALKSALLSPTAAFFILSLANIGRSQNDESSFKICFIHSFAYTILETISCIAHKFHFMDAEFRTTTTKYARSTMCDYVAYLWWRR